MTRFYQPRAISPSDPIESFLMLGKRELQLLVLLDRDILDNRNDIIRILLAELKQRLFDSAKTAAVTSRRRIHKE